MTIDPKVIDEALQSVQRRQDPQEGSPAEPQQQPVNTVVPAPDDAVEQIRGLREDLLKARQELRQREAELEASQAMGRETTARVKDSHERLLRAAADLENYKKRAQKERDEISRFGQEKLLKDVLPVLDNLDRALEHAKSPADFEALRTGLQMTRKLFEDTLGRFGVKGFSSLNQAFDPHLHEAMQSVESDAAPNTVVQEMLRGYTLNDRLIRPAMVAVAKARAPKSEPVPAEAPASEAPSASEAQPAADANAPAEAQPAVAAQESSEPAAAAAAPVEDGPAPSEPREAADSTDARGAEDVTAEESSK